MRPVILVCAFCFFATNLAHAKGSKFQDRCADVLVHRKKIALGVLGGATLLTAGWVAHGLEQPNDQPRSCAASPRVDVDVFLGTDDATKRAIGSFKATQTRDTAAPVPCLNPDLHYQFKMDLKPEALVDPDEPEGVVPGEPKSIVVYRYVGPGGHYFALNKQGITVPSEFSYEGDTFQIYLLHYEGTTALYSCTVGPHQFLSVNKKCEGQPDKPKRLGYINGPNPELHPLFRFRDDGGDYIEDTDYQSLIDAGYTLEGILGYVP